MTNYDRLMERLQKGEKIILDGATGTEVERRGVPQLDDAWNGGGALSHPKILQQIHEDYIRHGAEIIISNTFATSRHALSDAGVGHQFEEYNRRGVEIAINARTNMNKPNVLVAGGISYWSWTGNHPPLNELKESVSEQAAIMKQSSAELLLLEMMVDIDRMLVTLKAAQTSGLPVWVGLSCRPDDNGVMCLYNKEPLSAVLDALADYQVPLINVMHTDVAHVEACLDILEEKWTGFVGVYAHTGDYIDGKWIFDNMISPEDYADYSRQWLTRQVQVIGGCCGIRADHIAALGTIV